MGAVMISVDPHKRSNTVSVLDGQEREVDGDRFVNDTAGYKDLLAFARRFDERVWAVEGARGAGRHLAQRLVADGEEVWDVPAKLAARVRVLSTGQGRKSDAADARSIGVAALRTNTLLQVVPDDVVVTLKLLSDRRSELVATRTQAVNRLHRLIAELRPGGAKRALSATKAKTVLASIRPRDQVGKIRRQLAADHLADVVSLNKKIAAVEARIGEAITASGSTLTGLFGVGAVGAARILGEVGEPPQVQTGTGAATARTQEPAFHAPQRRRSSSGRHCRYGRLVASGPKGLHTTDSARRTVRMGQRAVARAYVANKR